MRRLALLQYALWAIGLTLEVLAISALLRGAYKRFPLVFAYCVTLFLTTVVEVASYTAAYSGARELADKWKYYYWVNDALLQALVFAVVISLIYRAIGARVRARRPVRLLLVGGALSIFAVSFLAHRGPISDLSGWMTLVSRDLSFSAVILDLLLWMLLIASRGKDRRLLLLSGALGIQFTGAAIGQSVRQLARGAFERNFALAVAGSMLVVFSNLICLYVWWQAFRAAAEEDGVALPSPAKK